MRRTFLAFVLIASRFVIFHDSLIVLFPLSSYTSLATLFLTSLELVDLRVLLNTFQSELGTFNETFGTAVVFC